MASKKAQPTEVEVSATPQTLIGKLDYLDKKISGWIHGCVVKPAFLELIIFPFAFLF
jgi:hypothetical protein